jgi:hypothetical protein
LIVIFYEREKLVNEEGRGEKVGCRFHLLMSKQILKINISD